MWDSVYISLLRWSLYRILVTFVWTSLVLAEKDVFGQHICSNIQKLIKFRNFMARPSSFAMRLDSNIESKSSNNTYLNIIEILLY